MATNKSSPTLMLSCVSGKHIDSAVLSVRKAGASQDYVQYTFSDVLITSFQTGGASSDQGSTDQVSLNFVKFESDYTPSDANGKFLDPIKAFWDVQANVEIPPLPGTIG